MTKFITAAALVFFATSAQAQVTIDKGSIPDGWVIKNVHKGRDGDSCTPPRKIVLGPVIQKLPNGGERRKHLCVGPDDPRPGR